LRIEAAFVSAGFGIQCFVSSTRGEEFEKFITRMRGVCRDFYYPFPEPGPIKVLDGGEAQLQ